MTSQFAEPSVQRCLAEEASAYVVFADVRRYSNILSVSGRSYLYIWLHGSP